MEINEIKYNNKGEPFIILERAAEKCTQKHTYYKIQFLKSGYINILRSDDINKGCVKDKLSKACRGVGSIGYINTREYFHEYKIWSNMIDRCYNTSSKSYKYYGAKGVRVCERWHRFDYFVEDIRKLPGFDENLFNTRDLKLDKDLLSKGAKIYSPSTCMWVSDLLNQKVRALQIGTEKQRFAVFPDGHIEKIYNLSNFCKTHNLHRQNVNLCLAGKQKTSKGFKFYKE